jgi:ribose transport system substrate-binding protein
MKTSLLRIIVLFICISMVASFSLIGCQKVSTEATTESETTVASETTAVTTASTVAEKRTYAYFSPMGNHPWHIYAWQSAEFFADDIGVNLFVKDANSSSETQIKQAKYLVERGGIDGAIYLAVDDTAAPGVDYLTEANIPTIIVDRDTPTDKSPLYIAFGNVEGAEDLAEEGVKLLEKKFGEAKGTVAIITGPMVMSWAKERLEGAQNIFGKYPNIKVEVLSCDPPDSETVYDLLTALLLKYEGKVDLIYSAWGSGTGISRVLEDLDMKKNVGEEGHIILEILASEITATEGIKEGYVDIAFTQPQNFYGPLAMWLLEKWNTEGKEAMMNYLGPLEGTIEADVIPIHKIGKEHMGVNVFEDPFWAPALFTNIGREDYMHPQLKVSGTMITKENADKPYWEGNALELWR